MPVLSKSLFGKIKFIVLALILAMLEVSFAQDTICSNYSIDVKLKRGYIAAHSPTMTRITRMHFNVLEAAVNFNTTGTREWHQLYYLPSWGITGIYTALDKSPYFGSAGAILSHFNFKIVKGPKIEECFKLGLGMGYIQRVFDLNNNYKNYAISSHFNVCITTQFVTKIKLRKNQALLFQLALTHFSNGAFKMPNKGINIFSAGLGVNLASSKKYCTIREPDFKYCEVNKKISLNVVYSDALKEIYPEGGRLYNVSVLSLQVTKPYCRKSAWSLTVEGFYDPSLSAILHNDSIINTNWTDNFKLGIAPGYELRIDKLSILMQLGVYAYDKNKLATFIYDRIGLRYYFKNNLIGHLALKTHFGNADFIELGLGYRIRR